MKNVSNRVKHWRARARKMRALSEAVVDPNTRDAMLRLAVNYDTMALTAELSTRTEPERANTERCLALPSSLAQMEII